MEDWLYDFWMFKMPITFTKVKLPNGWLSNMSPHPVVYQGQEWRTTEALFQALRFEDLNIKKEIRAQRSPMGAKFVAKKHAEKMTIEPMSLEDIANMQLCLRLKIEQHPELRDKLLATGDERIIEDVGGRKKSGRHLFWGAAQQADGYWCGQNYLGLLWMALRDKLRSSGENK